MSTKKLVRDKDEPILLDGKKTLGNSLCFEHDRFDADDFPWQAVLNLPGPYVASHPDLTRGLNFKMQHLIFLQDNMLVVWSSNRQSSDLEESHKHCGSLCLH